MPPYQNWNFIETISLENLKLQDFKKIVDKCIPGLQNLYYHNESRYILLNPLESGDC